jgi:hypothetical protein
MILVLIYPNPPVSIYTMHKLIAALGAAGFLSGVTGLFLINLNNKFVASGAMGIFIFVFYAYPVIGENNYLKIISEINCKDESEHVMECKFTVDNRTVYWVNKADTLIVVSLSGTISLGFIAGDSKPDGIEKGLCGIPLTRNNIAKNIKHGALIYKLGNEDWQALSENKIIICTTKGLIQFDINDKEKENNQGQYEVIMKHSSLIK